MRVACRAHEIPKTFGGNKVWDTTFGDDNADPVQFTFLMEFKATVCNPARHRFR